MCSQEGSARGRVQGPWQVDDTELTDEATIITDTPSIHLLLLLQVDCQLRHTIKRFST